jgi:hypothetical protein
MGKADSRSTFARLMRHAPAGARAYFLQGADGRIPARGGWSLEPFQPPLWAPPGLYHVCYLPHVNSDSALPGKNPRDPFPLLRLDSALSPATDVGSGRVPVQMSTPSPVPALEARAAVKPAQTLDASHASQWSSQPDDPLDRDPEHLRNRVEHMAQMMKDQIATNRQLAGKELMVHRELGEAFVLSRAYRQELEIVAQHSIQATHRSVDVSQKYVDILLAQMQRLDAQFKAYTTPPTPMDYVTAFSALLKEVSPLVREVVGALKPKPNDASLPAQKPAAAAEPSKPEAAITDAASSRKDSSAAAQSLPAKPPSREHDGSSRTEKSPSRAERSRPRRSKARTGRPRT